MRSFQSMKILLKSHHSHPHRNTALPLPPPRHSVPIPRALSRLRLVSRRGNDGVSFSPISKPNDFAALCVSDFSASIIGERNLGRGGGDDDGAGGKLAFDGVVYQKTLRLVECSMFAAVAGLAYLLSSSLAIENYFGCFFSLPIVLSSMRWGVAAGRKTMVATTVLLFVLSGPVKALTYLLMYGLVGLTMGSLWRSHVNWSVSLFLCTLVRATGAVGYVLLSSFLIRENILALITINVHAGVTLLFNSLGFNAVPSMSVIYVLFGTLVLLNCGFFLFLLHILYALFLARLGMKSSLNLPGWLEKAL